MPGDRREPGVDTAHQLMKMAAAARQRREAVVEQIHQPGLAAPDATPQVQPARRGLRGPWPEPPEQAAGRTGFAAPGQQLAAEPLQPRHRRQLGGIAAPISPAQFALIARRQAFAPRLAFATRRRLVHQRTRQRFW